MAVPQVGVPVGVTITAYAIESVSAAGEYVFDVAPGMAVQPAGTVVPLGHAAAIFVFEYH